MTNNASVGFSISEIVSMRMILTKTSQLIKQALKYQTNLCHLNIQKAQIKAFTPLTGLDLYVGQQGY